MNYQKLGKELKSQDELAVMDGGKCILQVRGVRPFFSDKFDITRHKQYHMLLDDKMKRYAARLAKKPRTAKDKPKSKDKEQGIE